MRKMLIWSRMTPLTRENPADLLLKNKINTNSGNLLFYEGVVRAIYREDLQLEPFFYEDVDRLIASAQTVNEEYEAVIIPLANAFRKSYMQPLRSLTRFIRAVKIPCYVIGVGIQANKTEELAAGRSFDRDVKAFVDAVLEKSPMLGLRGEYTAEYLKNLGYAEERHYRVIGCPSAYIRGPEPAECRAKDFVDIHKASFHSKSELPADAHTWIESGLRTMQQQAECIFVPQILYEFWQMYFGYRRGRRMRSLAPGYYPMDKKHPLYKNGQMRGFLSARDWIAHMQEVDLAFGSRIHGSMAAVNAGTPAIVLAADLRIEELARYHGIPFVPRAEAAETDIQTAYERADFGEFFRKYDKNYRNFLSFLDACGIDHIYKENPPAWGAAPLDAAIAKLEKLPVIHPGMELSLSDRIRSIEMYTWLIKSKIRLKKH